jgi:hypothetical protein
MGEGEKEPRRRGEGEERRRRRRGGWEDCYRGRGSGGGGGREDESILSMFRENVPLELVGKVAGASAVAEPGHVEGRAVARHGDDVVAMAVSRKKEKFNQEKRV